MECQSEELLLPVNVPGAAVAGPEPAFDSWISRSNEPAALVRRFPPRVGGGWSRFAGAGGLVLPGGRAEARRSRVHTPEAMFTGAVAVVSVSLRERERNPGRLKEGTALELNLSADL